MKASKSVENKRQCGKNPEDAILGVENGRQSECIVQKEGNNAVKESAETVEAGPIPAAAEGCSGSEEGLMEEEDTVCKPPLKRKQGSETCGSKAKKAAASGEQEESVSSDEQAEVFVRRTSIHPTTTSQVSDEHQREVSLSKKSTD
ncbi:unnamed protein product [Arctogadus glacialis]